MSTSLTEEGASDLFRPGPKIAWPVPEPFRAAPIRPASRSFNARRHRLVKFVCRWADELLPYLITAGCLALQFLLQGVTTEAGRLVSLGLSAPLAAGLIVRWSRRRYGRERPFYLG